MTNTSQCEVVELDELSDMTNGNHEERCVGSQKHEAPNEEKPEVIAITASVSVDKYEVQHADLEGDDDSRSKKVIDLEDSSKSGSEEKSNVENTIKEEGSREPEVEIVPPDACEAKKICKAGPSNEVKETRSDRDFVSEDAKENSDNFSSGWDVLKKAKTDKDKLRLMRERWGNVRMPDPSVDLTYRHRNNPGAGRSLCGNAVAKAGKRKRSQSCVSHMEKLIIDVKTKYFHDLMALFLKQKTELEEMYKSHEMEVFCMVQCSWMNSWRCNELIECVLNRQRQVKENILLQYQKGFQELEEKMMSSVALYEKYAEEMRTFHQYYRNGNYNLTEEESQHLEDTERMYKEYEKFYV